MSVAPRQATPALLQVDAILARLKGRHALEEVCRFLRDSFRHYRWVGVYRVEGDALVLDAWDGSAATQHVRIPLAEGLCGRAAREGRSVVVDDVRAAPEYLACFLETRSEIVVPVRRDDRVIGEIDIDGNEVGAYDASDRRFLEAVAAKLTGAIGAAADDPPAA